MSRGERFVTRTATGEPRCIRCQKPVRYNIIDHLAKCDPGVAIGILEDIYSRAEQRWRNLESAQASTFRALARYPGGASDG